MKLMEIKEMSPAEMSEQLGKSCVELVNLRMKLASRQLEDTSLIRKKRKEIARLLTVQTHKDKDDGFVKKEEAIEVKKTKKVKQVKDTKRKLKDKEEKDA